MPLPNMSVPRTPEPGAEAQPVSFQEDVVGASPASPDSLGDPLARQADPFAGQAELSLSRLIPEVLGRNRSLQAAVADWREAAQRYPQAVSLDDPMFGFLLGPASWGSRDVDAAWAVQASQKFPWPGKRSARGRAARAGETAAYADLGDARLRLVTAAKLAYFDYYLVGRQQELNRRSAEKLGEFREIAVKKYEASQVTQQDVSQAEVEVAELQRRELELARQKRVAMARINTLLHRAPDRALPAPPAGIVAPSSPPAAARLRQLAVARRPDLAALSARLRQEEAAVTLAAREFYPDLELVARYDSFWQRPEQDLRPQVGMNVNVPTQRGRRFAALREASARVARRRAELEALIDQANYDVQSAVARLDESRQAVQLYTQSILPASERNIESAMAGYTAGSVDFLRLIEAQRQLYSQQGAYYEALAEVQRRAAELELAVGGPVPTGPVPPAGAPETLPTPGPR